MWDENHYKPREDNMSGKRDWLALLNAVERFKKKKDQKPFVGGHWCIVENLTKSYFHEVIKQKPYRNGLRN